MDRREILKLILSACAVTLTPAALQGSTNEMESAGSTFPQPAKTNADPTFANPEAFEWLRMGEVKPSGWIKEQMLRDLRQGFAGCLDQLCHEASSDIFVSNRNSSKVQNTTNEMGVNWWNGETEGNWRAGHIMMAYLSEDPEAMREADRYVKHILGSQDPDGYLGVFAPDLRYAHPGELWTQACLLRGLLAYAELAHNDDVLHAVRRAVDLTVETYRSGKKPLPPGESHDLMFVDVLERMFALTGDARYRDFALWFYDQWSTSESKWDATLPSLLDVNKGFVDHGVHTYENIRVPLWLASATGRADIQQATQNAFVKIAHYSEVSGSGVSQEWIKNLPPDPSHTEYEYCATKELQLTFESALQKTGRSEYGDRAEAIWFNAAQGARLPDGSAISYLTSDNRFRCDGKAIDADKPEKRNKFSPAHVDVAVCCNPNATQVAALFVRGMWMKDAGGGLVAALYGPCSVSTSVHGTSIRLEERTNYPFEPTVEVVVHPEHPVEIPLRFRNPLWSHATRVVCEGAKIEREGDYWSVRKIWRSGDTVRLEFTPQIEQVRAANGETAIRYGALLLAEAIPSTKTAVKHYDVRNLEDTHYEPKSDLAAESSGKLDLIVLAMQHPSTKPDPLHPFDTPMIEFRSELIAPATGARRSVTLVPLGSAPILRRVTFPLHENTKS